MREQLVASEEEVKIEASSRRAKRVMAALVKWPEVSLMKSTVHWQQLQVIWLC